MYVYLIYFSILFNTMRNENHKNNFKINFILTLSKSHRTRLGITYIELCANDLIDNNNDLN